MSDNNGRQNEGEGREPEGGREREVLPSFQELMNGLNEFVHRALDQQQQAPPLPNDGEPPRPAGEGGVGGGVEGGGGVVEGDAGQPPAMIQNLFAGLMHRFIEGIQVGAGAGAHDHHELRDEEMMDNEDYDNEHDNGVDEQSFHARVEQMVATQQRMYDQEMANMREQQQQQQAAAAAEGEEQVEGREEGLQEEYAEHLDDGTFFYRGFNGERIPAPHHAHALAPDGAPLQLPSLEDALNGNFQHHLHDQLPLDGNVPPPAPQQPGLGAPPPHDHYIFDIHFTTYDPAHPPPPPPDRFLGAPQFVFDLDLELEVAAPRRPPLPPVVGGEEFDLDLELDVPGPRGGVGAGFPYGADAWDEGEGLMEVIPAPSVRRAERERERAEERARDNRESTPDDMPPLISDGPRPGVPHIISPSPGPSLPTAFQRSLSPSPSSNHNHNQRASSSTSSSSSLSISTSSTGTLDTQRAGSSSTFDARASEEMRYDSPPWRPESPAPPDPALVQEVQPWEVSNLRPRLSPSERPTPRLHPIPLPPSPPVLQQQQPPQPQPANPANQAGPNPHHRHGPIFSFSFTAPLPLPPALNNLNHHLHGLGLGLLNPFGPPAPDYPRARILLAALEIVPEGLVRRLDRVGEGEGGGKAKCAVCWGGLGEEAECEDERVGEGPEGGEGNDNDIDMGAEGGAAPLPPTNAGGTATSAEAREREDAKCPLPASAVLSLPCAHALHAVCLFPWLATHTTCPVCRFDLDPDSLTTRRSRQRRSHIHRPRPPNPHPSTLAGVPMPAMPDYRAAGGLQPLPPYREGGTDVAPEIRQEMEQAMMEGRRRMQAQVMAQMQAQRAQRAQAMAMAEEQARAQAQMQALAPSSQADIQESAQGNLEIGGIGAGLTHGPRQVRSYSRVDASATRDREGEVPQLVPYPRSQLDLMGGANEGVPRPQAQSVPYALISSARMPTPAPAGVLQFQGVSPRGLPVHIAPPAPAGRPQFQGTSPNFVPPLPAIPSFYGPLRDNVRLELPRPRVNPLGPSTTLPLPVPMPMPGPRSHIQLPPIRGQTTISAEDGRQLRIEQLMRTQGMRSGLANVEGNVPRPRTDAPLPLLPPIRPGLAGMLHIGDNDRAFFRSTAERIAQGAATARLNDPTSRNAPGVPPPVGPTAAEVFDAATREARLRSRVEAEFAARRTTAATDTNADAAGPIEERPSARAEGSNTPSRAEGSITPLRPNKRKYTAPVGAQTLRERVVSLEERAGLRCSVPHCVYAPSDDVLDDVAPVPHPMHALSGAACEHRFHPPCLVAATRARDTVPAPNGDGQVRLMCPVCPAEAACEGSVDETVWEEGEVEGDVL